MKVLTAFGRKYAVEIFEYIAEHQPVRFNEIREGTGINSTATISTRLDELEDVGLISRESFDENPPRVEYGLTDKGRRALPLLESFRDLSDPGRAPA